MPDPVNVASSDSVCYSHGEAESDRMGPNIMEEYNKWLGDMWCSTMSNMQGYNTSLVDGWKIENEDNSIQIAVQQTIENKLPELMNVGPKMIIVVR